MKMTKTILWWKWSSGDGREKDLVGVFSIYTLAVVGGREERSDGVGTSWRRHMGFGRIGRSADGHIRRRSRRTQACLPDTRRTKIPFRRDIGAASLIMGRRRHMTEASWCHRGEQDRLAEFAEDWYSISGNGTRKIGFGEGTRLNKVIPSLWM